jgi:hypothetical protein
MISSSAAMRAGILVVFGVTVVSASITVDISCAIGVCSNSCFCRVYARQMRIDRLITTTHWWRCGPFKCIECRYLKHMNIIEPYFGIQYN